MTAQPVHVVTDSTASLPPDLAARWGLTVVPLTVRFGETHGREGVDVSSSVLLERLRSGERVTTSQPAPEAFARAFAAAAAAGARAIVSVHLSGELSGTVGSARRGAEGCSVPVHVVDSRSVAMGLGLAALAAVEAVADGADAEAAAVAARRTGMRCSARFLVDSLDHLRRGGRLGVGAAALGTLLGMRPLVTLRDGRLEVAEKVRTRAGARARLEALTVDDVERRGRARVAVHHLGGRAEAQELADRLAGTLGERLAPWPGESGSRVLVSEASAVIGAHVGPGLIAVIVGEG
ncbi:MAG TPA: DegV family protein [Cellulomonadaceae bacterium]|nr:DegV family protein [Cellulomonadaceae bacterium]